MLLDALKDFSWYNEPEDVRFNDSGMEVTTHTCTDFWQSAAHKFHRDNAHFFFTPCPGDFKIQVQWRFEDLSPGDQAGIMLRRDNLNWFKGAVVKEKNGRFAVASSLTRNGYSDWSSFELVQSPVNLSFSLQNRGGDCRCGFSFAGQEARLLRLFYLDGDLKAGAYLAGPENSFSAVLSRLDFTPLK